MDQAMNHFRQARTIINRQVRDERLHYPFRVAVEYQTFLDRFGSSLRQEQMDEVARAAGHFWPESLNCLTSVRATGNNGM